MCLRILGICTLGKCNSSFSCLQKFSNLSSCTSHALSTRSMIYLSTECLKYPCSFSRKIVRHAYLYVVTFRCTYRCNTYTGVS